MLTLAIVIFVFNLLTEPLAGAVAGIFDHYDLLERDFFFASGHEIQYFISQLLILGLIFGLTVALGMIARYFFINSLLSLWDKVMHKIPLVRTIYKSSKDVINTLLASSNNSFKQVVLAPFPYKGAYAIGLVTQVGIEGIGNASGKEQIAVFIPTTPNPTSGFLMLYSKEDLLFLDMRVEEAFKYVLSCGVVSTTFKVKELQ